jgi:PKD repeat protein
MKKLIITLLIVIFGAGLFAAPVSQESAQKVAVNYYKHFATGKTDFTVSDAVVYQKDNLNTFYVFTFNAGGFILVAADDAVMPILGYSDNETFDKENIPANAAAWYESYSEEIKYIVDSHLDNTQTLVEWNKIRNDQLPSLKLVVTPLCSTTWDQGCYYNTLCPVASGGDCGHVWVGCVATAMAQVMKKWNYPSTGTGSHTYTDPTYGSQTANFGTTTYGWGSMPNNVSSSNTSVATLMYHCGVSVDMQYGTSGSGAYTWDVPSALINDFNYSPSCELQIMANFTSANWIALLKAELDAGRPVLYSGDNGTEGHAFVCDGYNASNAFHFNWGWSGSSNAYYSVGALNPSGYTFNNNNMAVVRIQPPTSAPVANFTVSNTTPAVGGSVNFTDLSTNSPLNYSWSFDGGSPATSTSQNPTNITYATAGLYQVSLTVSNASGTDTKVRTQYINVGGTPSKWIKQNSGFTTASRGVTTISIVNPYIVWAGAVDGTSTTNYIQEFTKTVNGGITWTPGTIAFTGSTTCGIANLCAFNDTVCYAAMFPGAAANGGYIAKTVNGGTTWSIANSPSYASSWLDLVYFFDVNNGVCVGDPSGTDFVIYTTSNGGTSWTQVSAASLPNCTSGEAGITDMFDAVGNTIWFGTTMGRIYKSADKGLTWTVTATGLGTTAAVMPVFKDANTGIVTGTNNSTGAYIGMKKTTNGGTTWTTLTPTGFYVKTPNLDYVPGTAAMWVDGASASGTGSSYSTNDCTSFIDIDTSSTIQYIRVKFYDVNTGWAGSFNTSSTDGGIYKWDPSILTGITEPPSILDEEINVFPNPANDFVNVEFTGVTAEKAVIHVYNVVGEDVLDAEVNPLFNKLVQLDLSGYDAGVYVVTIDAGSSLVTKRITLIK